MRQRHGSGQYGLRRSRFQDKADPLRFSPVEDLRPVMGDGLIDHGQCAAKARRPLLPVARGVTVSVACPQPRRASLSTRPACHRLPVNTYLAREQQACSLLGTNQFWGKVRGGHAGVKPKSHKCPAHFGRGGGHSDITAGSEAQTGPDGRPWSAVGQARARQGEQSGSISRACSTATGP